MTIQISAVGPTVYVAFFALNTPSKPVDLGYVLVNSRLVRTSSWKR